MFNVNTFRSNVEKHGLLRTNHFQVTVPTPQVMSNASSINGAGGSMNNGDIEKLLTFRAEQFKSPGVTLMNKQNNRYGVGPQQQMPYSARYADNAITFVCDKHGHVWTFWYNWLNAIMNFAGNDSAAGGLTGFNSLPTYELEYKSKYAVRMSVSLFENTGRKVQTMNLYDAFPISINEVPLNWGAKNEVIRLTVGITFKEFTIEKATLGIAESTVPQHRSAEQFYQTQSPQLGAAPAPVRNPVT